MKTIIILSGAKRSGKDTAAGFIKSYLKNDTMRSVETLAFADKLKSTSAALLNEIYGTNIFTTDMFSNEELRQGPFPGPEFKWGGEQVCLRTVLQKFGTEICRNCIDTDIWVKALINTLEKLNADYSIITDARFPNEITLLKKHFVKTHNIITILITRPGTANTTHVSETQFDNMLADNLFDYIIMNNSSLEQLNINISNVFNQIRSKN